VSNIEIGRCVYSPDAVASSQTDRNIGDIWRFVYFAKNSGALFLYLTIFLSKFEIPARGAQGV
jgi:hypothetical protein